MAKFLVTLIAVLTIVAVPLSNAAAARTTDIYQLVRKNVTVNPEGLFAIQAHLSANDSVRLHALFDPLNAQLAAIERAQRPSLGSPAGKPAGASASAGGRLAAPAASWCGYVPRWAFEAFAWYVIIVGGAFTVVSLFVDATIFGLPAGAVLGAAGISIGLTGQALLWYVDAYMPPWGVYECIF